MADGQYDKTKPWNAVGSALGVSPIPPGPGMSNEERLVSEALSAALGDRGTARDTIVNLPQWHLFPSRFGYKRTQPTIYDVVEATRRYQTVNNFSGALTETNSTSTNSLGTV